MKSLTQAERRRLRTLRHQARRDLCSLPLPYTLAWHQADERLRRQYSLEIASLGEELNRPTDEVEHARNVRWVALRGRLYGAVANLRARRVLAERAARYEAWASEHGPSRLRRALDEIEFGWGGRMPAHVVAWERQQAQRVAA